MKLIYDLGIDAFTIQAEALPCPATLVAASGPIAPPICGDDELLTFVALPSLVPRRRIPHSLASTSTTLMRFSVIPLKRCSSSALVCRCTLVFSGFRPIQILGLLRNTSSISSRVRPLVSTPKKYVSGMKLAQTTACWKCQYTMSTFRTGVAYPNPEVVPSNIVEPNRRDHHHHEV